ncbi:MAG: PorT family protein [Saprospiraceae bacterium]|jgi:hypothetical protein|nr:PorT family protein [Saprospiraceae bacterium]
MSKRLYFASAYTFFLSGMILAQTLSIGPVAGANFSTISNTTSSKTLVGLSLGGFANYSIKEHLGLNGKLLFDQMGTGLENTDNIIRLNYIRVPLSAVYFFGKNGDKIRPKLFAGPYVGFLMNATYSNGDDIILFNGKDAFSSTDFGGLLGAGFNYIFGDRNWLNIDAGYNASFNNISNEIGSDKKNTGFQITAGVSFPIGR